MSEKNQFQFVRDISEPDKITLEREEIIVQTEDEIEENIRKARQIKQKRIALTIMLMVLLTAVLFILAMIWQADWSLMAIGDGLWLVCILEFFFGWILFVYNKNIFSPLIYGAKTFIGMFIGKRPKTDYYSYMKNIQDNQIPAYYYVSLFLTSFIVFIPALTILLILIK